MEALREDLSSCSTRVQDSGPTSIPCQLQHLPVNDRIPRGVCLVSVFDRFISNAVEARGQFVSQGRSAGNENRRWHGTRRECNLGDKGNTTFCGSSTCSLCCIVKTSFDLSLWGKKTGWGRCEIFILFTPLKTYRLLRFGKGIYTSSTSSK